jgi:hypothetical protein
MSGTTERAHSVRTGTTEGTPSVWDRVTGRAHSVRDSVTMAAHSVRQKRNNFVRDRRGVGGLVSSGRERQKELIPSETGTAGTGAGTGTTEGTHSASKRSGRWGLIPSGTGRKEIFSLSGKESTEVTHYVKVSMCPWGPYIQGQSDREGSFLPVIFRHDFDSTFFIWQVRTI